MTTRPRALEVAFVALLSAAAFLAVRDHQRGDSATMDEPIHLFAGWEYVSDGSMWTNLEHPPLMKVLAGLALSAQGLPSPAAGRPPIENPHKRFLGWLYRNRIPAPEIVQLARRPFPWLLVLLVVVVWTAGRTLFGSSAGMLAAALVALEPNVVAHAGLVHTDLGAALTMTAVVALAVVASERRHLGWWVAAGLALGVALATKFTAVLLLPVFAGVPLLRFALEKPRPDRRWLLRSLLSAALAVVLGIAVLYGAYAFCARRMTTETAVASVRSFLASRSAPAGVLARNEELTTLAPPIGLYAAGLQGVSLLSEGGRGANYLMGRVSEKPFPEYFLVAFLVKTTPAFLVFLAAALVLGGRSWLSFRSLAFALPAALLFVAASRSHFNIGVRHVLPVYALLALPAAGALASRLKPARLPGAAGGLVAASGLSLLLVHPFELSYFNAPSGGLIGGSRWLSDSNVDWGQDLARLAALLRSNGWAETTTVVAYGGLTPAAYMPRARFLDPALPLSPGRYAVSEFLATAGPPFVAGLEGPAAGRQLEELLARLRKEGRLVARVGGSIRVWDLPAGPAPH